MRFQLSTFAAKRTFSQLMAASLIGRPVRVEHASDLKRWNQSLAGPLRLPKGIANGARSDCNQLQSEEP